MTKLKEQLERLRNELAMAQRRGDFEQAGRIAYGELPQAQKALEEAEAQQAQRMVHEEVTDQDIAQVVSRWTGIPVDRMMEGERDKLLHMEDTAAHAGWSARRRR